MKNWQIIVKSFRRFDSLERFVFSVRQHDPDVEILIADDSFEIVPAALPRSVQRVQAVPGVRWLQLQFDSGLSFGRNRLVDACNHEFVVLCDDDYVFTTQTRVELLLRVLREDASVGLAGGMTTDGIEVSNCICDFEIIDGELSMRPPGSPWEMCGDVPYRQTQMMFNFFAARRETLLDHPWDEQFKITGEHLDFFLSLRQAGVRCVYCPTVIVGHYPDSPLGYARFRGRNHEFRPLLTRKWGLRSLPVKIPVHKERTLA